MKKLKGRGKRSPAFIHSIQLDHHVFINLHTTKVYCLPDDYEVIDSSLHDIKVLFFFFFYLSIKDFIYYLLII